MVYRFEGPLQFRRFGLSRRTKRGIRQEPTDNLMKNVVLSLLVANLLVGIAILLGVFGVFGGGKGGGSVTSPSGAPTYEYAVYSVDEIGAMVLKIIEEEDLGDDTARTTVSPMAPDTESQRPEATLTPGTCEHRETLTLAREPVR